MEALRWGYFLNFLFDWGTVLVPCTYPSRNPPFVSSATVAFVMASILDCVETALLPNGTYCHVMNCHRIPSQRSEESKKMEWRMWCESLDKVTKKQLNPKASNVTAFYEDV